MKFDFGPRIQRYQELLLESITARSVRDIAGEDRANIEMDQLWDFLSDDERRSADEYAMKLARKYLNAAGEVVNSPTRAPTTFTVKLQNVIWIGPVPSAKALPASDRLLRA